MATLLEFYKRNQESVILNVWIYALLSTVAFGGQLIPQKGLALIVGGIAILLVTFHGYLHQKAKMIRFAEVEYWRLKSKRYSWLLRSIRELIARKRNALEQKSAKTRAEFSAESIWKNLNMLYEFYTHYDETVPEAISFRVAFFTPTVDGSSLTAKFHHYADGKKPHYSGNSSLEREIFHREKSQTVAVRAWNTKGIEIAECPGDIHYLYTGQDRFIKSMIAYPILTDEVDRVIGVITVCADSPGFFKKDEVSKHEEYIGEFALRISLELARLERFERDNTGEGG